MPPPSPTVAAWELMHALRSRREELGMTVKALCELLEFSPNYWSAVEHYRRVLSEGKLVKLMSALEVEGEEQQDLLALREIARQRSPWSGLSSLLRDETLRLLGLEHGAASIRIAESLVVPGLLQTADYARAILSSDLSFGPAVVEQLVDIRLRRQQRLSSDDPLQLTAVVSEATLRQQLGGPAVLRHQLQHLIKLAEARPATIEIRVIPFTAASGSMLFSTALHLLDFASHRLPAVAWVETVRGGEVVDEPNEVRFLTMTYNQALTMTLDREASLRLIAEHAGRLR